MLLQFLSQQVIFFKLRQLRVHQILLNLLKLLVVLAHVVIVLLINLLLRQLMMLGWLLSIHRNNMRLWNPSWSIFIWSGTLLWICVWAQVILVLNTLYLVVVLHLLPSRWLLWILVIVIIIIALISLRLKWQIFSLSGWRLVYGRPAVCLVELS